MSSKGIARVDVAAVAAARCFKKGLSVQVEIASRHGTIRPADHAYLAEKAEKLITLFERITQVTVTASFGEEKAKQERVQIEILVDAEHKHDFVAHAEDESVRVSFDKALHKMEQQIRKYKERIQEHPHDRADGLGPR